MDSDPFTLLALLLDPCLTVGEARREAAATPRPPARPEPREWAEWEGRVGSPA